MGDVQILHEVGEFDLQQPAKLNEADQNKANADQKNNTATNNDDKKQG